MERPQADLSYVVEKIPMGPAFPTGQLHDISSVSYTHLTLPTKA